MRAWHRKTRRPVPVVLVKVSDDFLEDLPDENDPTGQRRAAIVFNALSKPPA